MTHLYQIDMGCNKLDSNNHTEIQAKTSTAVKLRNVFFTQPLMLSNIFQKIDLLITASMNIYQTKKEQKVFHD